MSLLNYQIEIRNKTEETLFLSLNKLNWFTGCEPDHRILTQCYKRILKYPFYIGHFEDNGEIKLRWSGVSFYKPTLYVGTVGE